MKNKVKKIYIQTIRTIEKNNKLNFLSLLVFIFLCLLLFNQQTHLIGDDFVYSYIYKTNEKIKSCKDIFESQYIHYYKWGGRAIVHSIAQALLYIQSNIIRSSLNSLAFVSLVYVMYKHIIREKKYDSKLLGILFFLTWLVLPVFAETSLWITGSANYLWGTLIILLFLLPYRLYKGNEHESMLKNLTYALLMFLGGVIAGWTNENTAAAMIIMILIFIFVNKKQKQTAIWMYAGLIGAIIGYLFMILAPGNAARASESPSLSPFLLTYRILTYTQRFILYLGLLNIGAIILYLIQKQYSTEKETSNSSLFIGIYGIATLISIYVMLLSPSFPARAWFGVISFNIICFGLVYNKLKAKIHLVFQIKNTLFIGFFILFLASFYDGYKDVSNINRIWIERENLIQEKKSKGENTITFKEYQAKTKFGLGDAYYALPEMSEYYDIEFILEK